MGQTLQNVLGKFKPLANTQLAAGQPLAQGNPQPTLGSTVPSMAPQGQDSSQPPPSQSPQPGDQGGDDGTMDDQSANPSTPPQRSPAVQAAADAQTNPSYQQSADANLAQIKSNTPVEHLQAADEKNQMDMAEAAFRSDLSNDPEAVQQDNGLGNKPAPFLDRVIGAIPKTREGQLSMFQKLYGFNNAKYDGNQFFYRDNEQAPWNPVAPAGLDFAAMVPNIAEGGAAALAAAPFVAGAAATMNPGPALVGATAGIEGAAWAASSMSRAAANYAAGVQEAAGYNYKKDFMESAGLGAAFSVGGEAVSQIGAFMSDLAKSSLSYRQEAAAGIRGAIDQIHTSLRMPDPEMGEVTAYSVGQSIKNGMDSLEDQLGQRVGLAKSTAIANAQKQGINSFTIDNGLGQLRKIIGDKAVEDPTTGELKLVLDGSNGSATLDGLEGEQLNTQLAASQTSAWGSPTGQNVLKQLVDKYNIYSATTKVNGGLPLQDLYDATTFFADLSQFDGPGRQANETILNNFKSIQRSFRADQASALTESLKGTPMEDSWNQAFKNYSDKMNQIGELGGAFQNPQAADNIAQMILTPGKPSSLLKIQQIFGADSPQMQQIRSLWISNAIDASIDPAKPVFDPQVFMREIDARKWGPEMMGALAPDPSQLNQLKGIANQAKLIQTSDFWKENPDKTTQAVGALVGLAMSPVRGARDLYRLVRGSPEFANYVANNGVGALIKGAANEEQISNIVQGMGIYEAMVDNSTLATVKRGVGNAVTKILVPASARTFAAAFKNKSLNAAAEASNGQQNMDALASQPPSVPNPVPDNQIEQNPGE